MSKRTVIDCDGCKKKDLKESYRLETGVDGAPKIRLDFCTACLGKKLSELVASLSNEVRKAWIESTTGKLPLVGVASTEEVEPESE